MDFEEWGSDLSDSDEEDLVGENMFVDNGRVLLLGLEEDITEEDLFNYFYNFNWGWAIIKRDPDTGISCGYAMIMASTSTDSSVINKKHKIKNSWVTALPTAPNLMMARCEDKCKTPEDKGKTFSTERTLRPGPRTIYVGGFSIFLHNVDAYTIGNYFSQYGTVEAVDFAHVIRRDPPSTKTTTEPILTCGWALVLFALSDSVDDVLAKPPHCIHGRRIFVYPTDDARLGCPLLPEPNETEHVSKKRRLQANET